MAANGATLSPERVPTKVWNPPDGADLGARREGRLRGNSGQAEPWRYRQQGAVSGRSSDDGNQRGWPIAVIWRRHGDRPYQQPVVAVLITV
jgi:hypothetical protein